MTNFSDLGLAAPLLKALEGEGYTSPTPIQAQAIPPVLAGSDLLGIAQTGTGKTAAFALPILHRLAANPRPAPRKGCRVLVLSPTRELASQIAESFRTYGRFMNMSVAVVFGGVGHRPQVQALARGLDVLIATPGRLLDHTGARDADLRNTEVFVLDEADQMLDLGFVKPIRQIVAQLPAKRQNLFFSATMPSEIAGLANDLLRNPIKVAVTPAASTVDRIKQRVIHVERTKKRALLAELLADASMSRTLVFTRTKRGADRVARHLETCGVSCSAIHGNKSQNQREAALDAFKRARIRVLVATDIAARGIDVDSVTHVVNFELPDVPEAYVHRIGRTARAGASGSAISLCDGEERHLLRDIERLTRQSIPAEDRRRDNALTADEPRGRGRGEDDEAREREARGGRGGRGGAARGGPGRGDHRGGRQPRRDDHPRGGSRPQGGRPDAPRIEASGTPAGASRRPDHAGRPAQSDRPQGQHRAERQGHGDRPRHERPHRDGGRPNGGRRDDSRPGKPRSDAAASSGQRSPAPHERPHRDRAEPKRMTEIGFMAREPRHGTASPGDAPRKRPQAGGHQRRSEA